MSSRFTNPRDPSSGVSSSGENDAPRSASAPVVSLPKGGGAIRGMGEKFGVNPATGTGSLTIPIATSPGRAGFGVQLSLSYDSGNGNGPFGLGWNLQLPSITRKTDKGLPSYRDAEESDEFLLSGAEDLVPILVNNGGVWEREELPLRLWHGSTYKIQRYRPRIEGLFARIERWTNQADPRDVFWRSISKDNVTTWYGKTDNSRIAHPVNKSQIFRWLICETHDDKGNVVVYEYKPEDSEELDLSQANEANRDVTIRSVNRYPKAIKYGNVTPYFPVISEASPPTSLPASWLFEVVFDYGEHNATVPLSVEPGIWLRRNDPFSSYRAGFEVRTYRLCQRVLMFHHFPDEPGIGGDCLVRSIDFTYSFENDPANTRNPILSVFNSVTQVGYKRDGTGYLTKSMPPIEFEYSQPEVQGTVRTVDPESLENLPYGIGGSQYQWVDLDGEGLSGILIEQASGWFYKRNLSPITTVEEHGQQVVTARFAPLEQVRSKPSLANLASGNQQLIDLAGDGQLDLVLLQSPTPGFYERTVDEQWETLSPFTSLPNVDWSNPNLKFVDLTGDGHADVLISEHEAFIWYPSLGESGFGPGEKIRQALDEKNGPCLLFADGEESIYLSDMSADGLNDLVRIRNGEVCYWPNLGYGRFGAKVTMDNAPLFDTPDQFDQKRLRLADIDGSGVTDIIYLKRDGAHIYFNQSGNSWSLGQTLTAFPHVDDLSSVATLDLLGNGTACLVWSSPLPADAGRSLRYIDLMGGQKPHLVRRSINNLGAETVITYAPSTRFYLADKLAGKPWLTKLPYPVQVVEKVETYDRLSKNRFVERYAYHHGYFDGVEREFRGFGMVEQWDTETLAALTQSGELPVGDNINASSHVPPVHTKTWFHTGAYFGRDNVSNFFAGLLDGNDRGEYYREPTWSNDDVEARKHLLDDTLLPAGLTLEDAREACRSLKGAMLRQEIYADDGTPKAEHPYTVTEQSFTVRLVQPHESGSRHAVFFTHPRESINYEYERNPTDPRTGHSLTLAVDEYGNTLRSIVVGYPRADVPERTPEQNETHITFTINRVVNRDDQPDWRHIGLPVETRSYELVKPPAASLRLSWEDLRTLTESLVPLNQIEPASAKTIPYEQWDWRKLWNPVIEPGGTTNSRLRLLEHVRTHYRPDDLGASLSDSLALLPLGTVESLALEGESYKLAFTLGLLSDIYQRPLSTIQPPGAPPPESLIPTPSGLLAGGGANRGGYVDLDSNGNWWIPSGRQFLSPGATDTPIQELAHATAHFFLSHRYRDAFHTNTVSTESFVTFDEYDLLVTDTTDQLGNRVTIGERDAAGTVVVTGNDYRVLQPRVLMDPNRNVSEVAFDAAGFVVGTAVKGKPGGVVEGDSLATFNADLNDAEILDHLEHPHTDPLSILGQATTRVVYDFFAYHRTKDTPNPQPAVVYTLARETHVSDPVPPGGLKLQHTFSYSDGFGREIQKKRQAEPGPVPERDGAGNIILGANNLPQLTVGDVSPRWIGGGWTVFNNKGKPVRQYEPFFTDTHHFEFDVRIGISPVIFYDPAERVVATLHANHTWKKSVFDAWQQETWDASDTILILDPKTDPHVGNYFARLEDDEYLPTWFSQRNGGALGTEEQAAASKAAVHAGTPLISHTDALGRTFATVAHNKFKYSDSPESDPPIEEFYTARFIYDIEGNQREVVDPKNRVIVRYDYDMLGNRIHQAGMEAGERWTLADVVGKVLHVWDSRDQHLRTAYDALRRPANAFLTQGSGAELLIGRTIYGESQPTPEAKNLRAKVFQVFDQAGVVTTGLYDFKGNALESERQLARDYKNILNWAVAVPMEADVYLSRTAYDALNRESELIDPDNSVIRPEFNEANMLERLEVNLRGALDDEGDPVWTTFVNDIDYDAKGLRTLIDYGNGVRTTYTYDPLTFRIVNLLTVRDAATFPEDCPASPPEGWPGCQVQNLHYVYDPAGNTTHVRDEAQQTRYFRNKRVEPSAEYTYDALYRLIEATGREHLGQVGADPSPYSYNDVPRIGIRLSTSDGNAVGRYLERYTYDAVGNFQEMVHQGNDSSIPGWTRSYTYDEPSQLEAGTNSNRLTSTTIGADTETYSSTGDGYDPHGNMLRMPQLQVMEWNFQERLAMSRRQAVNAEDLEGTTHHGERTWYVYNAGGERVRKVTESSSGVLKEERIYLGGFEIYRRTGVNAVTRETLHVMDNSQRIALVETRTAGVEPGVPAQLIRYQFGNHLSSASLELDDHADIISYEEYTPYGSTSYQAVRSQTETPKRYRFIGMERDDETGLGYHSARYFISWLGRWATPDPAGIKDAPNLYLYVSANPVRLVDITGNDGLERFLGGLKVVGGVFEVVAGGALIATGVATSEVGVGIVIGAGGVLVAGHGIDTIVSGARTVWNGAPVDTLTSQGLQAAGMSRSTANLVDAGIGVAGTLGAGALTRAPASVPAAVDAVQATRAIPAAAEAAPAVARVAPTVARVAPTVAEAAPAAARVAPTAARVAPTVAEAAPAAARVAPTAAQVAPAATEAAPAAVAGARGLVHRTTEAAAQAIRSGNTLGRGGTTLYAGPPSLAQASGLGITLRTGLLPSQATSVLTLPEAATGAFRVPGVIGPFTTWQRLSGTVYSAGAGTINMTTGAFTRTGAAWNQIFIYSFDATLTSTLHLAPALLSNTPDQPEPPPPPRGQQGQ